MLHQTSFLFVSVLIASGGLLTTTAARVHNLHVGKAQLMRDGQFICFHNTTSKTAVCGNTSIKHSALRHDNVESLIICKERYCVISSDAPDTLSCSGYVFEKNGVEINPLTNAPINRRSRRASYPFRQPFNLYNGIYITRFDQDVKTFFDHPIRSVACNSGHGLTTCVNLTITHGQNKTCFGGAQIIIPSLLHNFLFGIIVSCPMVISLLHFVYCGTPSHTSHGIDRDAEVFVVTAFCVVVVYITTLLLAYLLPFIAEIFVLLHMGTAIGLLLGVKIFHERSLPSIVVNLSNNPQLAYHNPQET